MISLPVLNQESYTQQNGQTLCHPHRKPDAVYLQNAGEQQDGRNLEEKHSGERQNRRSRPLLSAVKKLDRKIDRPANRKFHGVFAALFLLPPSRDRKITI